MKRLSSLIQSLVQRPTLRSETVILGVALFLALTANVAFWHAILDYRPLSTWSGWRFDGAVLLLMIAVNFLALGVFAHRLILRPLAALLIFLSGISAYYMQRYGIVIDANMLRNVLHTDVREASELLNLSLLYNLLPSLVAVVALWRVRLDRRPWRAATQTRLLALSCAIIVGTAALFSVFQDFASLMRNQHGLRYMVTPGNVVWSLARVVAGETEPLRRAPPELARRMLAANTVRKPTLLVMVVGETARAQNFSLNGYARATNPELAQLDLLNFPQTTSCGTSTEVSLPCMFSPFGRADYDETKIRSHESLLHVLSHAGMQVTWLDNQSGCKGVCSGLEFADLSHGRDAALCEGDHCYDEILLRGLERTLQDKRGDRVVVMHQIGNHGPVYFRRYPPGFKRFGPACEDSDLGACTREQIVNAYDNGIAYTDHVLARTVAFLKTQEEDYDVAMIYVSDHGESLGENGLFLHGVPYALAPREQTHVPMLWWLPPASARNLHVDTACLRRRAERPASHDNLYHSVLGLLSVSTPRYLVGRDLLADCHFTQLAESRAGSAPGGQGRL